MSQHFPTLADLGENEVVRRLTASLPQSPRTVHGPGDDCAVLAASESHGSVELFKTDCIVEGVHFLPETPGQLVGRKALCRGLSDLAAMGASPAEAVITLGAPADTPFSRVAEIYAGLAAAARQYGIGIAGGETVSVPSGSALFLNVALLGHADAGRVLLRSTAQPGDHIYVTGELGDTLSGHHLHFLPRLAQGNWLAQHGYATAAMDLSDGLGTDLPRLAAASGCHFQLKLHAIPCRNNCTVPSALSDGEDYELLFCGAPATAAQLETAWQAAFPDIRLSCIGQMTTPNAPGAQHSLSGGWEHFQQS